MIIEGKKKKKKPFDSITYTTGNPQYNMDMFNKHHGTGVLPGTVKASSEMQVDTLANFPSPDGASSVSCDAAGMGAGGGEAAGGDGGASGAGGLEESKRYVRRYYARPMDKFASNKAEIIRILIDADKKGENCSIYTLNNLADNNDVTKLTNDDIIYYYDDGILYDKNHVKVMDYDLMIKHEEDRDSLNPDNVSNAKFIDNYDDRITDLTGEDKDEVLTNKPETKLKHRVVTEDTEELDEDTLYVSKIDKDIELPHEITLLDKNEVEKIVSKLEPEEEFAVGYVTSLFFYGQLADKFTLVKCTELIGTTGVDYIEADADDSTKETRISISKEIENRQKQGDVLANYAKQPLAKRVGDSSADYEVTNRLVKQHRDNDRIKRVGNLSTILFYPTIGQKPKVKYFIDIKEDGLGFQEVDSKTLEEMLIPFIQKLIDEDRLGKAKWGIHNFVDKLEGEIESNEKTITAVSIKDDEDHIETRSRIHGQLGVAVEKKPVRALYTNQIYYIRTKDKTLGYELTEEIKSCCKKECSEEAFDCSFDDYNAYGQKLVEGKVVDDVCCICHEPINGYGNNPEPYMSANNGERCCDACNLKFVIPARMSQIDDGEEE